MTDTPIGLGGRLAHEIPDVIAETILQVAADLALALHQSGHPAELDLLLRRRPRNADGQDGCWVELRPAQPDGKPPPDPGPRRPQRLLARMLDIGPAFKASQAARNPEAAAGIRRFFVAPVLSGGWKLTLDARWPA